MYVPKGHAAQIFMCLYAFFMCLSNKVNKSQQISSHLECWNTLFERNIEQHLNDLPAMKYKFI